MQILLLVLKIIGLVLLGLIGFVIFLLLVILLWPIRYRLQAVYHEEPLVKLKVGWLGIIGFRLKFEKGKLFYRLSVLGIRLKEKGGDGEESPSKEGRKKKKKDIGKGGKSKDKAKTIDEARTKGEAETKGETGTKDETETKDEARTKDEAGTKGEAGTTKGEAGTKGETGTEGEAEAKDKAKTIDETGTKGETETKGEAGTKGEIKKENKSNSKDKTKSKMVKIREIIEKIISVIQSIPDKVKKLIFKIRNIFKNTVEKIKEFWNKLLRLCHKIKKIYEFIALEENHICLKGILKIGTRLLKHMAPRKIKGYVRFGMKDPCATGQLLGVLAVFYGWYGKNIQIYPEFDEPCLDGEILIRGHMQIGVMLFYLLKIYFSREFKTLKYNYQKLKEEL